MKIESDHKWKKIIRRLRNPWRESQYSDHGKYVCSICGFMHYGNYPPLESWKEVLKIPECSEYLVTKVMDS